VQTEDAVVVAAHAIEPLVHVSDQLVVESNLRGVQANLPLDHRSEGEPNEAGEGSAERPQ
jgi:hypothetical protein